MVLRHGALGAVAGLDGSRRKARAGAGVPAFFIA